MSAYLSLRRSWFDLKSIYSSPRRAVDVGGKEANYYYPVVMTNAADPVGAGLVASLARPGGNVTGLSSLSPELGTKRLEILKDAVPKLARVGLLRPTRGNGAQTKLMSLGLRLRH